MLPSSPAHSCFFFLPPELPRKKKANKEQFPLVEQQQKNVISSTLRLLEQQGWSFRGRSSWRCVLYYGAPLSISTDSPLLLAQCRKWRHSTKRLHPLQFLLTWFLRQTPPPPSTTTTTTTTTSPPTLLQPLVTHHFSLSLPFLIF